LARPVEAQEDVIMQGLLTRVSTCFAGGVFGALMGSLGAWMAGQYGWTAAMGVAIAPQWEGAWLYPRLVLGGLWGLLFLPSTLSNSLFWRGLVLSLVPTLVQLLVVFPLDPRGGVWGLGFGGWTPVYVLLVNALWGWTTASWVMAVTGGQERYHRLR